MTTLLLVRHGTTEWVETELLHGITDIPLNDKGMRQAADAARSLRGCGASILFSSPLSRCLGTAQEISKTTGMKPIQVKELAEINFGWLEGTRIRAHDVKDYGKLRERLDHWKFNLIRGISGESRRSLVNRVKDGLTIVKKESAGKTAIVVAHSGIFNTILMYYYGKTHLKEGETYHRLLPGSITELRYSSGETPELVRLNDISHISKENL